MPVENANRSIAPVIEHRFPKKQKEDEPKQSLVQSSLHEVRQAESGVERKANNIITPIDYNTYRSVKSFGSRVRFIVMHYTAANFKTSVNSLTQGAVSAHYLVPDPTDPSYRETGNTHVKIFNLVDEKDRAWHAGVSGWKGRNNINDTSIGIEIVNQATNDAHGHFIFPPFDPQQISALKTLATNIIQRHPDIRPTHVVGHSDIAWHRKSDPGASFPWQQLSEAGIGAWYDEETKEKYVLRFNQAMPPKADIINKLKTYGYDVAQSAEPDSYKNLVRAFQLHFRPQNYSGQTDVETVAILYALVEKYA